MQVKFSEFELLTRLGRSALGDELFTCRHPRNPDSTLVMRVRMGETSQQQDAIERFQKELFILTSVSHPHIIRGYDLIRESGCLALTMEFAEGGSLAQIRRSQNGLDPVEVIKILIQLAEGVVRLHEEGIIHGNLSPKSSLLSANGEIKIGDFSRAQFYSGKGALKSGNRLGTPMYASPEYLKEGVISPRLDQYSLGLIGYELLTGSYPFNQANPLEQMRLRLELELPSIASRVSDCPEFLSKIIDKAVKLNPAERFDSVKQFLDEILNNIESKQSIKRIGNAAVKQFARIQSWFGSPKESEAKAVSAGTFVSDGSGAVFRYKPGAR